MNTHFISDDESFISDDDNFIISDDDNFIISDDDNFIISDDDNFIISDDDTLNYEDELYNYINYNLISGYDTVYYTDAANKKNIIFYVKIETEKIETEKIETEKIETENTIFIKLEGRGNYNISIYRVDKVNNFIGDLMNKFFKPHMDKINNYLLSCINIETIKDGIYFNKMLEHKKITKQNNQKSFMPSTFEQMCILLGLEIRTYSNIECKNKIITENNLVNTSHKMINLYKLVFRNIFGNKYSHMVNYKIIKDSENIILVIFEFQDSYYILHYIISFCPNLCKL